MKIDQNWPKIESFLPSPQQRILRQKGREVFKMTTNLCEKFVIYGSFDEKP